MRHLLLLLLASITISVTAQKRKHPYKTFEVGTIHNVVIQLSSADLYFDIKSVQEEIRKHDWSVAGKTAQEVSKLKAMLSRYQSGGLLVTPAMLKDQSNADFPSFKLLAEYVPGLMLRPFLQGRVYKPSAKSLTPLPIEFSQTIITETPFVARYLFYFEGEKNPFLSTQGIGTPEEKEEEEAPATVDFISGDIDPEEDKKYTLIHSFDYTPTTKGYASAGTTSQGDTVQYSWQKLPSFKGGSIKLEEFLATRVKFPESAIKDGVYGTVIQVGATFMKDGTVRDIVISKGDPRFEAEAIRLLQESSGMWLPGTGEHNKKQNTRCEMELLLHRTSR